MVNSAYQEHGDLPSLLSVQFDGASTNKRGLTLAYLGLFVIEGVFLQARARCELKHRAHEVYDGFHAIHAGRVKRSTFYELEGLRGIIRGAHERLRDRELLRPIGGHGVKVSDLWEVLDFWEWLAPGCSSLRARGHAVANAAFARYIGLGKFRDFRICGVLTARS
jgi:hypothetical protein